MKTISVRDFLRGGYKDATEPLIVMNHSTPIGVWDPTNVTLTPKRFYGVVGNPFGMSNVTTTVWDQNTSDTLLRYDEGE